MESLPIVQRSFEGELFYKTPLWKLEGRPEPPKEDIAFLGPEPDVPGLSLKPYGYQKDGIKFMIDRLNNVGFCLNGDSVGLGKTIMSIGAIKWFVENRGARKILVVCKKSIKTQWAEEIRRIADWQNVPICITGETRKKRLKAYEEIKASKHGILITNYQNFLNDTEDIDEINFDICIVDEAHCVKKRDGVMNNNISKVISGKRVILLTGTPVMSKPDDIYGIISMAMPGFFGSYEEYAGRYIKRMYSPGFGEQIVGAMNLDELRGRIQKFLIARTAEDVELELPGRNIRRISCSMDKTQKEMLGYVNTLRDRFVQNTEAYIQKHGDDDTAKQMRNHEMVCNYALQFIADDPAVFRGYTRSIRKGSLNDKLKEMLPDSYKISSKTEIVMDLVSEIIDAGEKVIVFCHWASPARMLADRFSSLDGARVVMYTGAENQEKRDANVEAFKTDPSVNIIIGTEAMAEGLNLQVCPFLINYEQADTHAVREQRIGRICRLGSSYKHINVIDLVTEESKDESKMSKIERDSDLSKAMLGSV